MKSVLCSTPEGLALKAPGFSPVSVDFSLPALKRRFQAGKKQGLIRACQPKPGLKIIDATAGWGRDSALLASFGATVWMIEKNPTMAALLQDALTRLPLDSPLLGRLHLIPMDSIDYLKSLAASDRPSVIYIDPMHPLRTKSAQVKKDMQLLQTLVGPDDNPEALLIETLKVATHRVVLKWPEQAAPLRKPDLSIHGKTVRFDVYFPKP